MRLRSDISVSNLVLFIENQALKKFDSLIDIFTAFCEKRLFFYGVRKESLLKKWGLMLLRIENRFRFLKDVAADNIRVFRVPDEEIALQLESAGYDKFDGGYDYLVSMRISQFSKERLLILEKEILALKKKIAILKSASPSDLWKQDLVTLCGIYQKQYPDDIDEAFITKLKQDCSSLLILSEEPKTGGEERDN